MVCMVWHDPLAVLEHIPIDEGTVAVLEHIPIDEGTDAVTSIL